MLKVITALLSFALVLPSTVMGQSRMVPADQIAKALIRSTNPASIEGRGSVGRNGGQRAAATVVTTTPDAQRPPDRSWPARHPVALGAMIGAVGGGLWGASECWRQVCGDNHGPLLVLFGAGLGAGIGAGVGVTISIATG